MRENYDFSNAIKNPYKFTEKEKIFVYIEYLYKLTKLDKITFKKEVDEAISLVV